MAGKEVVSPSAPPKLLDFSGVCQNTYSILKLMWSLQHDISLKGNDKHIVSFNCIGGNLQLFLRSSAAERQFAFRLDTSDHDVMNSQWGEGKIIELGTASN